MAEVVDIEYVYIIYIIYMGLFLAVDEYIRLFRWFCQVKIYLADTMVLFVAVVHVSKFSFLFLA